MPIVYFSRSENNLSDKIGEWIVTGVFFVAVKVERNFLFTIDGNTLLASPLGIRISWSECCIVFLCISFSPAFFVVIHITHNMTCINDSHRTGRESVFRGCFQDIIKDLFEYVSLEGYIGTKDTVFEE